MEILTAQIFVYLVYLFQLLPLRILCVLRNTQQQSYVDVSELLARCVSYTMVSCWW